MTEDTVTTCKDVLPETAVAWWDMFMGEGSPFKVRFCSCPTTKKEVLNAEVEHTFYSLKQVPEFLARTHGIHVRCDQPHCVQRWVKKYVEPMGLTQHFGDLARFHAVPVHQFTIGLAFNGPQHAMDWYKALNLE